MPKSKPRNVAEARFIEMVSMIYNPHSWFDRSRHCKEGQCELCCSANNLRRQIPKERRHAIIKRLLELNRITLP